MGNKINNTLVSFVLMLAIWTLMFGTWQFALVVLVLIGIHEMGHYLVAKALQMNVSTPIFTPIGALINMRELPKNAYEEAIMAYGGPFVGTLGALACLVLGYAAEVPLLIIGAKYAFFLNLFNLIPLAPLDGGRISMAIDRRLWPLGVVLLAALFYFTGIGLYGLIVLFFIGRAAIDDVGMRKELAVQKPEYFAIGAGKRITVLLAYLGLVGSLLWLIGIL